MTTVAQPPVEHGPEPAIVAGWVVLIAELATLALVGTFAMIAGLNTPYRDTGEWQFTPNGRDYLAIGVASLFGAAGLGLAACLAMANRLAAGWLLLLSGLALLIFGLIPGANSSIHPFDAGVWLGAAGLAAFPGALFVIGSLGPKIDA